MAAVKVPKFTEVAVVAIPVLVVVPFELQRADMAVLLATPEIVKVKVGSMWAITWTDSMVPILVDPLSSIVPVPLAPLYVSIATFQISATPADAVLVGLIKVGT